MPPSLVDFIIAKETVFVECAKKETKCNLSERMNIVLVTILMAASTCTFRVWNYRGYEDRDKHLDAVFVRKPGCTAVGVSVSVRKKDDFAPDVRRFESKSPQPQEVLKSQRFQDLYFICKLPENAFLMICILQNAPKGCAALIQPVCLHIGITHPFFVIRQASENAA